MDTHLYYSVSQEENIVKMGVKYLLYCYNMGYLIQLMDGYAMGKNVVG